MVLTTRIMAAKSFLSTLAAIGNSPTAKILVACPWVILAL